MHLLSSSSRIGSLFFLAASTTSSSPPPPSPSCRRNSTKVRSFVISSSSSSSSSFESSSSTSPSPWGRSSLKRTVDNPTKLSLTSPPPRIEFDESLKKKKKKKRPKKAVRSSDLPEGPMQAELVKYSKHPSNPASKSRSRMPPGRALELLNEAKKTVDLLLSNSCLYTNLIISCCRWSNFEEGVEIYNDMVASKRQPGLYTYMAMIRIYGRLGRPKEAEKIFEEMRSKGVMPDVDIYNSLIEAFAKRGNVKKVREICDEMVEVGIAKDKITYNTIVDMYVNCGLRRAWINSI